MMRGVRRLNSGNNEQIYIQCFNLFSSPCATQHDSPTTAATSGETITVCVAFTFSGKTSCHKAVKWRRLPNKMTTVCAFDSH